MAALHIVTKGWHCNRGGAAACCSHAEHAAEIQEGAGEAFVVAVHSSLWGKSALCESREAVCTDLLPSGKQEHMFAAYWQAGAHVCCYACASLHGSCRGVLCCAFSRHPAQGLIRVCLVPRSGGRAKTRHTEGACSTSGGATCSDCQACRALSLLGLNMLQQCWP